MENLGSTDFLESQILDLIDRMEKVEKAVRLIQARLDEKNPDDDLKPPVKAKEAAKAAPGRHR